MPTRPLAANKYESLRAFLVDEIPKQQPSVWMNFAEIEARVGEPLPDLAKNSEWWSERPSQIEVSLDAAGFGVGTVACRVDNSVVAVHFVRRQRFPGVLVSSAKIGKLRVDERLRELAIGYLQSAKKLCIDLGENPTELNWPRATVVCYCYYLSIELFLKACIRHRESVKNCSHDISKLRNQYLDLYKSPEYGFSTPFDKRDSNKELREELKRVGSEYASVIEEDPKALTLDVAYRFLSDKVFDEPPEKCYVFAPGLWLAMIESLEADIGRIWNRIQAEWPHRSVPKVRKPSAS